MQKLKIEAPLILLAGGKSSRMGNPKGLLEVKGRPLLIEQIHRFRASGGKKVLLILGHEEQDYRQVLTTRDNNLTLLINPNPEEGQFSSIRLAAREVVERNFPAAFLLPIDVPAAKPEVWQKLWSSFHPQIQIVSPRFQGLGGHPVLLGQAFLQSLLQVQSSELERLDQRMKAWPKEQILYLEVNDTQVLQNLNDPISFQKWKDQTSQTGEPDVEA